MKITQKITTASLATVVYLTTAIPAFAEQEVINPCPGTLQGVCEGEISFSKLVGDALSYLFVGAAVIAVIFLIWGGIKWITSGGDKAKVESARGTIIGAIVGLVIVFASYFIISLVLSAVFGIKLNDLRLPSLT